MVRHPITNSGSHRTAALRSKADSRSLQSQQSFVSSDNRQEPCASSPIFPSTSATSTGISTSDRPRDHVTKTMTAICALRSPRASASTDLNPLFAMFCRCLERCLLRGHERPTRRCRRCAPVSLYVAGVCLNRIGNELRFRRLFINTSPSCPIFAGLEPPSFRTTAFPPTFNRLERPLLPSISPRNALSASLPAHAG